MELQVPTLTFTKLGVSLVTQSKERAPSPSPGRHKRARRLGGTKERAPPTQYPFTLEYHPSSVTFTSNNNTTITYNTTIAYHTTIEQYNNRHLSLPVPINTCQSNFCPLFGKKNVNARFWVGRPRTVFFLSLISSEGTSSNYI